MGGEKCWGWEISVVNSFCFSEFGDEKGTPGIREFGMDSKFRQKAFKDQLSVMLSLNFNFIQLFYVPPFSQTVLAIETF